MVHHGGGVMPDVSFESLLIVITVTATRSAPQSG